MFTIETSIIVATILLILTIIFLIYTLKYYKLREDLEEDSYNKFLYECGKFSNDVGVLIAMISFLGGVFWYVTIPLFVIVCIAVFSINNMYKKLDVLKKRAELVQKEHYEYFGDKVKLSYKDCIKEAKKQIADEKRNKK